MTTRRFRFLFLVVALALLAPLAFLVERALRTVGLERQLRHRAVAERVFDEMERALSRLLEGEEARPIDGYGRAGQTPALPFVVGRFQLDPGGGLEVWPEPAAHADAASEIQRAVTASWRTAAASEGNQLAAPERLREWQSPGTTVGLDAAGQPAAPAPELRQRSADDSFGSAYDALRSLNKGALERVERQKKASAPAAVSGPPEAAAQAENEAAAARGRRDELADARRAQAEAEPMPMTGRLIDPQHLLLYRTVVRETRGYRQGVLLDVPGLGDWLRAQGLGEDGLAEFASVAFSTPTAAGDPAPGTAGFAYQHRFAEPFDDLTGRLTLRALPGTGGSTYVYALTALVLATTVLGLAALYRMVSVVVSYAERRGNFVAAVTHELKTPLTAVRMYAEMLRDGLVPSDAKRAEYYRHITVESERLSRLIDNVLELARLERGGREMAMSTGPVEPVVREVAELLGPHVARQGFELQVDVAPDLPPARFARDALVQVLCNLVDNAVKYACDAAPKRIVLRAWGDGDGVHVAVRDHGPGVTARHLGRIFDPFYRGEAELTRSHQGTGLGLALVRGLAERMGARVGGRNAPQGGFEVELTLRAA